MGFEVLFEKGRRFEKATVEPIDAGTLRITSGTVSVCDPSSDGEKGVLERAVPNGAFPVLVSRAYFPKNDVHAIAAAMVKFTDARVVDWQPALPKGEDPATLEPGEYFGYGVDAGIACFVDGARAAKLDFDHFEAKIVPKLEAVGQRDGYGEVELEGADGRSSSLVAFNTGAGDGLYVSFWGFDAKGELAALCTEFRVAGTEETKGREILAKHWPGTPPPEPSLSPMFEVGRKFKGAEVRRLDVVGTLDLPSGVMLVGASITPEEEPLGEDDDPADYEPHVPAKRHFVLEGLPKGSFEVRMTVNESRRGKRTVEVPGALYVALSTATATSWTTAVPSNLGDGVSLAFESPYGGPLGLYDGSLKEAIDDKTNQETMRAAFRSSPPEPGRLEEERPWTASVFAVAPPSGAALRAVGVVGDIPTGYVFIGRASDDAICCVVVPLSRDGQEVTRMLSLAETKRKELASKKSGGANDASGDEEDDEE